MAAGDRSRGSDRRRQQDRPGIAWAEGAGGEPPERLPQPSAASGGAPARAERAAPAARRTNGGDLPDPDADRWFLWRQYLGAGPGAALGLLGDGGLHRRSLVG